jgi:hypothetical protein
MPVIQINFVMCSILLMANLTLSSFFLYVYLNPLHVSSNLVLIIRRTTCINTTSGMSLCVGDRLVCRSGSPSLTCPSGVQVGKSLPDVPVWCAGREVPPWPARLVCRSGSSSLTCPSGVQVGNFLPDLHTRRPSTHSDIYQTLYWYSWFSRWWARGCSKHVEDWNKHIRKKSSASSWLFTRIIPRCGVRKT